MAELVPNVPKNYKKSTVHARRTLHIRKTLNIYYSKFLTTVSKIKVHYDIEDSFISSSFFFDQEVSCGTSKQPPVNQNVHCQSQCHQKLEGGHTEAASSVQILHVLADSNHSLAIRCSMNYLVYWSRNIL